ncbi:MAG TPA: copper resistance CopC family protein [Actinomycetota bacterium]|nr:copper resistance CopC family protein [Actinomycetota bacterium]
MAAASLRHLRLLLAIAVAWLSLAGLASGHAAYEDSTPRNGETVSSPPDRVIVDFTERIVPQSTLSISDPCGAEVDNNDSVVVNDRITVSMSADKEGTYTVRFAVQSAVDGHNTEGQFTFTSSGGSPCNSERQENEPDDGTRERRTEERTREQDRTGTEGRLGDGGQGSREAGSGRSRDRRRNDARTKVDNGDRAGATASLRDTAAGEEELEVNDATSIWDGIPLGEFAVALGVAALIGAAGGRIYAGIMGPVDKRSDEVSR